MRGKLWYFPLQATTCPLRVTTVQDKGLIGGRQGMKKSKLSYCASLQAQDSLHASNFRRQLHRQSG